MSGTLTLTEYSATGWRERSCYLSDLSETTRSAIYEKWLAIVACISTELDTTNTTEASSAPALPTVKSEQERLERIIGTGTPRRQRLLWDILGE